MSNSRPQQPNLPQFDPFNASPIDNINIARTREKMYVGWLHATTPPNTMPSQQLGKPALIPQTLEQKQTQQAAPWAPKKQPNNNMHTFYAAQAPNVSCNLFFPGPNDLRAPLLEQQRNPNCEIIITSSLSYPSHNGRF